MDTDGSIMQLNEASTNELAMVNSRRSTVSHRRLTSRTRDLSKPKYTNDELDSAIYDDKIKPYSSEMRKSEGQHGGIQQYEEGANSPIIVAADLMRSSNHQQERKNMSASCSTNMMDIDEATPGSSQQT